MIDRGAVKDLVLETVRSPGTAAQKIMALRFSRDTLWTALFLAAAANSIIYSFSVLLYDTAALPPFLTNPLIFFVIISGVLVMSVHAFYWTGRAAGGSGDLGDLLALMVWLQALRAVAQFVLFVLTLLSPIMAQFFSLIIGALGLWITVNFVTQALHLRSLLHGLGVLLLAAVGLVFGLLLLGGLIGLTAMGIPANV
ncbi:YIP1 family protein [uncultured Sulfitobacter sp.]|uniref:YIP1 family protein n=1 Tax=uncultured Sulfitobacter sp. TaxID=191468 RepID=UPI002610FB16|nr:YIP1 family protein [uncultured Sulfitobacter sp.]